MSDKTGNIEAVAAQMRVGLPTAYRVLSSIGSTASTLILAMLGILYSEVREEWHILKTDVEAIRLQIANMPTAEEYQKTQERIDALTERIIVLESHYLQEAYPLPDPYRRTRRIEDGR
jgi:hypothetical protein